MTSQFRYDQFVEDALRSVVRRTLDVVAENGLPGNHHLYITFNTQHPGVDIPSYLVAQYPDEMTIVMQHQFWGLEVTDSKFAVTLSFNKVHERLVIPFDAITAFADPSVNFGLQFKAREGQAAPDGATTLPVAAPETTLTPLDVEEAAEGADTPVEDADREGNVVTLDAFRKK